MRNVNVRAFLGLVLLSMAAQVWSGVDVRFVSPADVAPDVSLVVPTVNGAPLAELDEDTRAVMVKAVSAAAFGKEAGATLPLYGQSGRPMLLLVELGEEPLNGAALETLGGTVSNALLGNITSATVLLNGITLADGATLSRVALGSKLGGYRFDKYQTETDDAVPTDLTLELADTNAESLQQQWLINGQPLADAVYFSRDLISEPANIIYPESFVARVKAAFKGIDNVRIRVLDEKAMAKQGMEVLLGVGMGSARPPRLLVIEYKGAGDAKPLVFAGKGITFDTGGVSLKNPTGLWRMKYDMSGAAAVTGTLLALAGREANVNAVAIAALAENMASDRAQRPGDVRTSMSGKTVEVINTDAEGRLVLADAVWYAQTAFDPEVLVDIATLTGSVRVALGTHYAGMFSRQDVLATQFLAAGKASGEAVWRLPLNPAFVNAITSDIADVKNVVEGGSGGGASIGAEFIGSFVKPETPWVHFDIAGRAWEFEGNAVTPKGAAGFGIRLLNQFVADNYE
ncbi:putative cytosol aminopeptidase [Halioglobus pacificus]|uniref:Probable cytosol aminopeptidase n=1 Tax=Parahalioglobus pacificus TaxID=930806 RepID=A0A918XGF4_9GAMM|nr:putative cytosol aminopeptidase [Halioglobus pacificus]